MPSVTVVTDSTAYLPVDVLEAHGVGLVSLYYSFGDGAPVPEASLEDYGPFYERLRESETLPTTSPPTVEDFVSVYAPLLEDDGHVVSIHISSALSETCATAREAAERLTASERGGERVQVLDSAATGGQLGLVVLAAARVAVAGEDATAVAEAARFGRLEAKMWWMLDTLDYLRRGGRIGSAAAWIGSTLNVKPILTIESEIKAVERVRTRDRGIERLVDYAQQFQAARPAWEVQHTCAPQDAQALADRLQERFRRPPELVSELGPVLGTHTGPGLIGFGVVPSRFLE